MIPVTILIGTLENWNGVLGIFFGTVLYFLFLFLQTRHSK